MKRILLGFAAFTLMLTGCQKSEVVDDISNGNNELSFGVYQGNATRAGEQTNGGLQTASATLPVKLYAYNGNNASEKTLYFTDDLEYLANTWKTSVTRFLPQNGELQLYAYHPAVAASTEYDGTTALAANGFPTLIHTIGTTSTDQVDLLAAKINDNTGKDIVIPMKHILSQVNFGVKGYADAKIEIRDIKVNKVYNRGQFDFGTWDWKALDATGTTTISLSTTDYNYSFAGKTIPDECTFQTPGGAGDDLNTYIFGDGGKGGPGNSATTKYVTSPTNVIAGPAYNGELSNSLMLMPQDLLAGTTTNAYVTFEYRISDMGGAWVVGGAGTTDWVTGTFDLNFTNGQYASEWSPNMRYVYIIDFKGFLDGQKLTFDVDVETNAWENYNNPGDGIVLLSSAGQPIFKAVADAITAPANGTYAITAGNVFTNITWDWSSYTMNPGVFTTVGQSFTVTFNNVIFNGNTITVKAPKGFSVSDNGVANGTTRTLTFTTLADAKTAPVVTGATNGSTISAAGGVLYDATTWTLTDMPTAPLTAGQFFTIDASKVWLNGKTLTVTVADPANYKVSGSYPKFKITKLK